MDNSKLSRFTNFAVQTWDLLSPNEQESYFCGDGIYGFIEDCMIMLHLSVSEFTTEDVEYVADRVLRDRKDVTPDLFATYIPTYDMSVIFEQETDDDDVVTRLRVCGFYYGKPNDHFNRVFYNDTEMTTG